MKVNLKFFLFVCVFLMIGCGSRKYYFENKKVYIKSKILETHQVIDNKLIEIDGMFCLFNSEDLNRMKDNFSIKFLDEKLANYNFQVSYSNESCLNNNYFGANIVDLHKNGLHKVEIKNLSYENYYVFEKKIDRGYIQFGNATKSEIDLKFLLQKFNEIKIIEN